MKRLIFVCAAVLLLGSCTQGFKMPKGFEQDLRALYAEWQHVNEPYQFGGWSMSQEQLVTLAQQDSIIEQKYGLKEQAVKLGYYTEEFVVDTALVLSPQFEESAREWMRRNATPEFQKLAKDDAVAKRMTIDEIVSNNKLLPIEKLRLVIVGITTRD